MVTSLYKTQSPPLQVSSARSVPPPARRTTPPLPPAPPPPPSSNRPCPEPAEGSMRRGMTQGILRCGKYCLTGRRTSIKGVILTKAGDDIEVSEESAGGGSRLCPISTSRAAVRHPDHGFKNSKCNRVQGLHPPPDAFGVGSASSAGSGFVLRLSPKGQALRRLTGAAEAAFQLEPALAPALAA